MQFSRRPWASPALIALFMIAAYAGSAWFSLENLRGPDGRSALYISNGFLLSGLLLLRGGWRWLCLVGSAAACALVVIVRGGDPVYAVGAGAIAGISCLTGEFLGRRVLKQPKLRTFSQAIAVLTLVIIPSSFVSGVLSSLWLSLFREVSYASSIFQWFFASLVGVSMILPTILIIATPSEISAPKRGPVERLLLGAVIAGFVVAPYVGFYYVALMVAFPLANLLALRLGARPTALAMTAINVSAFAVPFLYDQSELRLASPEIARMIILGLQIYMVVVFYNGVLTALAIDQNTRTKRRLEQRTAMARKARAEALEASRAKTEFLATMSHEIRTPLNSILGFSQVLDRRDDLPKDVRRQIGMIQRSGESLLTVVNDILDFSRVEAGKLALDPRSANLATVAEDALAIIAPSAREKGLETHMALEGEVERLHLFDDQRVRQVLLNFLNNAVKFTEAGRIDLTLSVQPQDGDHDLVRLSVRDTGVGIPVAAQAKLFQRFTQADSSISRSYGGAGLGLSICKGLVELMGGRVGVESGEGKGSNFWFEIALPRAQETADADDVDAGEDGLCANVLLVDDNAANRDLGVTVLTMLGCTADTASDGAEAVEAARTRRYDIILMDVHMPGMDGLAATRAIRALEGGSSRAPIIAMTADVLPEQIERCRAAGMVDHLAKPINIAMLSERIARWFGETIEPGEIAA